MTDIRKVVEIRNRLEELGLPIKILAELDRWIKETKLQEATNEQTG